MRVEAPYAGAATSACSGLSCTNVQSRSGLRAQCSRCGVTHRACLMERAGAVLVAARELRVSPGGRSLVYRARANWRGADKHVAKCRVPRSVATRPGWVVSLVL